MGAGGGGGCLGLACGPTAVLGGRDQSRMSARASVLWLLRRKTQTLSNDLPEALHTRKHAVNVSPQDANERCLAHLGEWTLSLWLMHKAKA